MQIYKYNANLQIANVANIVISPLLRPALSLSNGGRTKEGVKN